MIELRQAGQAIHRFAGNKLVVRSEELGDEDALRLTGHMSDDVEHFYSESCTCHLMSNIAF
jgi:hypothetical protein